MSTLTKSRVNFNRRDIIIVGGVNCVGKSLAMNEIKEHLRQRGIGCDEAPSPQYTALLAQTIEDDATGGKNHYHPQAPEIAPNTSNGHHSINAAPPLEPFIVVGNTLYDKIDHDIFSELSNLKYTPHHYWIVDLTNGVNRHPKGDIHSLADRSFERLSQNLRNGYLPSQWLDRAAFAINPLMEDDLRKILFDQRNKKAQESAKPGQVQFLKPDSTLLLYGNDDFATFRNLLIEKGLNPSRICSLSNNGTIEEYKKALQAFANRQISKQISIGR